METIYYHLNARRVKVAGGPELMTFSRPHAAPVPVGGGQLLDFERGKLRLERKALLMDALAPQEPSEALAEEPAEDMDIPAPQAEAAVTPAHRLSLGLDLLTSGAILAACCVIIRAFAAVL